MTARVNQAEGDALRRRMKLLRHELRQVEREQKNCAAEIERLEKLIELADKGITLDANGEQVSTLGQTE